MGRKGKDFVSSSMSASRSASSRRSILPPDYSVEEDKFGRLVNREKRLVWPKRQPLSRKAFKEFLETPPPEVSDSKDNSDEAITDRSDMLLPQFSSHDDCITFHEKYAASKVDGTVFIGVATSDNVEHMVVKSSFLLYYRKPTDEEEMHRSVMKLYLAYRDNNDQIHHFPVLRRTNKNSNNLADDRYMWKVDYGEKSAREFTNLSALVKYYQLFAYYDPLTGQAESFLVLNARA